MTIQTSTLRPGLLVSLKTSVRGNVTYSKVEIEAEHVTDEGTSQARWETQRTITDAAEHDAARKARSQATGAVRSVCAQSAFGLLCPEANAEELDKAIETARSIADAFNAEAKLSRIHLYVMVGRIAPDDVEAIKAINSEVRDLLDDMAQGMTNLDPKAIREAASRARQLGSMLSSDSEARVRIAIETARAAAKKIVAAGEQAAQEVDKAAIRKITEQRTAFLDLSEAADVKAPKAKGVSVDLKPAAKRNKAQDGYQPDSRAIELE